MEIVNNALFLEKILNKLININTAMLEKTYKDNWLEF